MHHTLTLYHNGFIKVHHLSELSISEEVDVDENVDKESKRFEDKQIHKGAS